MNTLTQGALSHLPESERAGKLWELRSVEGEVHRFKVGKAQYICRVQPEYVITVLRTVLP